MSLQDPKREYESALRGMVSQAKGLRDEIATRYRLESLERLLTRMIEDRSFRPKAY